MAVRGRGFGHSLLRVLRSRAPQVVTGSRLRLLEAACWLAVVATGAAQQWASIDLPSSIDLVSYLDIGDAWWHGNWATAINGYWNPLYSWILGFALAVVRPSARFEYPLVEAVDFLNFLFALASFAWMLRGFRQVSRASAAARGEAAAIPDWAWIVGGYALFALAAVRWTTLSSNTPDMIGAAVTYLAYGLVLRLDDDARLRRYVLLGVVLGLGYLSRTPLLVVGLVLVAVTWWQAPTPARRRGLIVSLLVLLALSAPFVAAVSLARGHLTIGDNGRLNHAWLANPRPYVMPNRYWQGGPEGSGTPRHPVRVLWDEPAAYEFAGPIDGTYPPWTDPSYWYEGLTYRFDASAEWMTLESNLRFCYRMFGRWLLFGFGLSLLLAGSLPQTARAFSRHARYWVPAIVGIAVYLAAADLQVQVHALKLQPPQRYIAAFVVLLVLALAASFRRRRLLAPRLVATAGGVAIVAGSLWIFSQTAIASWKGLDQPAGPQPWQIAAALQGAGISRQMPIATIGRPDRHDYWARLSRARIVADVPDDREFWSASPEVRDAILERLGQAGAKAAVSCRLPPETAREGWQTAEGTTYAVRSLAR